MLWIACAEPRRISFSANEKTEWLARYIGLGRYSRLIKAISLIIQILFAVAGRRVCLCSPGSVSKLIRCVHHMMKSNCGKMHY